MATLAKVVTLFAGFVLVLVVVFFAGFYAGYAEHRDRSRALRIRGETAERAIGVANETVRQAEAAVSAANATMLAAREELARCSAEREEP